MPKLPNNPKLNGAFPSRAFQFGFFGNLWQLWQCVHREDERMTPFWVLNIQSTLSLILFILIARWYVAPRLSGRSRDQAVLPLLWIHAFRYAPLTLLAPGQADPRIPADVVGVVAYGDFVAALFALLAIVAVHLRLGMATALVWLFSIVSIADLVYGTARAVDAQMYTYYMGWSWYIVNFYVPMLIVSQVMIVYYLVKRPRADEA
jgi:hypothetical protein